MKWAPKKYRESNLRVTTGRDLTPEETTALRDGEVIPVTGRDVALLMDSYDQIREGIIFLPIAPRPPGVILPIILGYERIPKS